MANAVAVRDYGDQYQALVFWKYALDLLKKDSDIENIGYEYDEIKSFDDIVIFYKKEQTFRNTTIDRVYIQVKFHMKQNKEFTIFLLVLKQKDYILYTTKEKSLMKMCSVNKCWN